MGRGYKIRGRGYNVWGRHAVRVGCSGRCRHSEGVAGVAEVA